MFDINEIWDIPSTLVPPRSHLYHLKPIGIGTPYVESLTSYIERLALAHNVSLGRLLLDVIVPLIKNKNDYANRGMSISHAYSVTNTKQLNGITNEAISHVRILEQLTLYKGLSALTMLAWKDVFSVRGLLRANRAWCSQCYKEWKDSKQTVYEPLIWFLNSVKICPFHNLILQLRCPYCEKSNRIFSVRSKPGYCSHCYQWLGASENIEVYSISNFSKSDFEWQSVVIENIGGLLATSSCVNQPISRQKLSEILSLLCIERQASVTELARQLGLEYDPFRRWVNGESLIPITSLLEICSALGTSLSSFLTSKSSIDSSILIERAANFSIAIKGHTKPQRKRLSPEQKCQLLQDALVENPPLSNHEVAIRNGYANRNQLRIPETISLYNQINVRYAKYLEDQRMLKQKIALEAVLDSSQYPPLSLLEAAKQIGKSKDTLRKNFPVLCCAISQRYRNYREMASIKNILKRRQEIWLIVLELHEKGISPTLHKIASRLQIRTMILRRGVLEIVQEAQNRVGFIDNSANR